MGVTDKKKIDASFFGSELNRDLRQYEDSDKKINVTIS